MGEDPGSRSLPPPAAAQLSFFRDLLDGAPRLLAHRCDLGIRRER